MKKEGYVKIYSTLNIAEAHTIKFLFENNGIEAVIENQEMNPFFGMVAAKDAEAQVWVPENASKEAAALLAESSSVDLAHIRLYKCRRCGEMVCTLFDYCWNCMASMKTGRVDLPLEESQADEEKKQSRFPALYIPFVIIIALMLIGFVVSRFFRGG
ncbi:MAG TPA: DUF2007 domain-containing protein [Spirochaetota bacterium]|nr:DUF2007 domain-containing protein [Spirochaetota bacterium]HPC42377.1 DUF2007 domain-containing protein [Spirochaetota bacterium]HPL16405.1 DUF2007 domain-containing protein [Spirochaetota bacterium]HQF08034.1 DUF2007 domain-containing protein [Spirochaetota bacterium]HQH96594.1 DUF2007 domain-containing protein [Spirochaetota bacterium]